MWSQIEKLGSRPESEKKPNPNSISWGLWASHSTCLGLSFLLHRETVRMLRPASLGPHVHGLAASPWFLRTQNPGH